MQGDQNSFESDYKNLLKIVRFMLNERKISFLLVEDLIADIYIKLNNQQYSRGNFLKDIKILIIEGTREHQYRDRDATKTIDREKVCFKCKELLPIGNFGITNVYRYGGSYVNSYCRECARKHVSEYQQARKKNPEKHRAYLDRLKEWKKKRKRPAINRLTKNKRDELRTSANRL